MEATYVAPQKTPLTFDEAAKCMKWALQTRIGTDPSTSVLALAMAKSALETGRWTSIWNANWGNVKASDTYEGMYTCIVLNELLMRNGKLTAVWFAPEGELSGNPAKGGKLVGKPVAVPPGHPQTRMRAFANNWDGVDQYVEFVANGRYKKAWAALLSGSAKDYVHELKVAGYFTAIESEYLKGVASLQKEFAARIDNLPDVPDATSDLNALLQKAKNLQFDLYRLRDAVSDDDSSEPLV